MIETSCITPVGDVDMEILHADGRVELRSVKNTVLRKGREALASSLANQIGNSYDFFVHRMIFGNGGTDGSVPKFVDSQRNGLFGVTVASKGVIATISDDTPSQVVFTSVLTFDEGNGYSLNEMALRMNTGNLYSMTTFPDLTKTSTIQITFNWNLNFI